jgi:hypothetical protein
LSCALHFDSQGRRDGQRIMRRCFLHIGTHKTGTTAIQTALKDCRANLMARGYLYPTIGIPAGQAGQHNLAWQLRGDRRFREGLGTVDDLFREIDGCDHDVILSSEDFECAAGQLGRFMAALQQRGLDVVVVVFIRDQISYACSLYFELIKAGYDRAFCEFLSELIERHEVRWQDWLFTFDYRALLGRLPPESKIVARHFSPEISIADQFASILGLTPADLRMATQFRANNRSLFSKAFAEFYRTRTGLVFDNALVKMMRSVDTMDVGISCDGKQRLIAAFGPSNRWMNEHYGMPTLDEIAFSSADDETSPTCLDLELLFSASMLGVIGALGRTVAEQDARPIARPRHRLWPRPPRKAAVRKAN